jgi:hypothetical protein
MEEVAKINDVYIKLREWKLYNMFVVPFWVLIARRMAFTIFVN